jgi:hypothetical protein
MTEGNASPDGEGDSTTMVAECGCEVTVPATTLTHSSLIVAPCETHYQPYIEVQAPSDTRSRTFTQSR